MEKKIIKSVLNVIKYLAALYGAVLVFNHLNAWAGIALALVVIVAAIINIISFLSKNQEKMKNFLNMMIIAIIAVVSMTSCERVAPNYAGVLMENYGKAGKEDFSIVVGRVWTASPGTELFQVPLFDQRGQFDKPSHLKAADNTEFTVQPMYSYKVVKQRAIDVVFDNKHIGSGEDFMESIEDNILEPRIRDLIKEESRKYKTEVLMEDGGSLKFEKTIEKIIEKEFEKRGLQLISFSCQLDFAKAVKEKIENRNEVNTNLSVLEQQIAEQKKRNELEELKTQQALIKSRGLTREILYSRFIDKWDGKTPIYGAIPDLIKVQK